MLLLANENFPRLAVEWLRSRGHDIAWILTDSPGISDQQVIERAIREKRVLLTQDKDFGELAFHWHYPIVSGIILIRLFPPLPSKVLAVIERLFGDEPEFGGDFVVVEEERVRRRALI